MGYDISCVTAARGSVSASVITAAESSVDLDVPVAVLLFTVLQRAECSVTCCTARVLLTLLPHLGLMSLSAFCIMDEADRS